VSGPLDQLVRQHWWAAVATVCRLTGDLDAAEDAVQDACVVALEAMAEGPAAGLVILDALAHHPQLRRWAQLYIARAELLRRLGRDGEAADAYRSALELEPAEVSRSFIGRRLREVSGD
jgi:predicted RNA polymerase sigma factor